VSVAEPIVHAVLDEAAIEERAMLRQDVHNRLVQLKKLTELGVTGGLEESLEDVNRKIERYNEIAPAASPVGKVTRATFIANIALWE